MVWFLDWNLDVGFVIVGCRTPLLLLEWASPLWLDSWLVYNWVVGWVDFYGGLDFPM
jgi:hypothetical protein